MRIDVDEAPQQHRPVPPPGRADRAPGDRCGRGAEESTLRLVVSGRGLRILEDVVVADPSPPAAQLAFHRNQFEGGATVWAGK